MEHSSSSDINWSSVTQEFSVFYRTWWFITAFTRAPYLSQSLARSIQFMPHIPLLEDPFILSSLLCLGLLIGVFPWDVERLLSPIRTTCHAQPILDLMNRITFNEQYLNEAPRYVVVSTPCYHNPVRYKYLSHPILQHICQCSFLKFYDQVSHT